MTRSLSSPSVRPQQLLSRILEQPELVDIVQDLEAPVLARLIEEIGLEDSGELVALATTQQLQQVFDTDLWRSRRPGEDETFDAERFGLWLQVMMEVGVGFAAQKLTELDEDLVTLAISRHVLVIDLDALAERLSDADRTDEDERTDKALQSCLYEELGEYQLISRDHQSWDAVIAILVELDRNDHDFLVRLLDRCHAMSTEYIDGNGGLYDVLTSEEMLESDVAADREDRREQEGYVAPSSAASLLNLARVEPLERLVASRTTDPITRSYFRATERPRAQAAKAGQPSLRGAPGQGARSEGMVRLLEELREAEVLQGPARKVALLGAGERRGRRAEPMVKRAVAALRDVNPEAYSRRLTELAYLANVLVSGCSVEGRAFRPMEAVDAAVAVCNLGLEHLLEETDEPAGAGTPLERASALLERQELVKPFQIGWHVLHHEVLLFTARALHEQVVQLAAGVGDGSRRSDLTRIAAALKSDLGAGRPWRSYGRVERLAALLDRPELLRVRSLLSECPVLPRWVEGEGGAEEQRDGPRFIATREEILVVQERVGALEAGVARGGSAR